jgi:hypothetical protein
MVFGFFFFFAWFFVLDGNKDILQALINTKVLLSGALQRSNSSLSSVGKYRLFLTIWTMGSMLCLQVILKNITLC